MSDFYPQLQPPPLSFRLLVCLSSSQSAVSLSLPVTLSVSLIHMQMLAHFFPGYGLIHSWCVSMCPFFPLLFSLLSLSLCSIDRTISPLAAVRVTIIWWWTRINHFTVLSSPLRLCMVCCCVCGHGHLDVWICVCEACREREKTCGCVCVLFCECM